MKKIILATCIAASISAPALADQTHTRRGFGIGLGYAMADADDLSKDTGVAIDLNWTFANGLILGEMLIPNVAELGGQVGDIKAHGDITMAATYLGYEARSGMRYKGGLALTFSESTVSNSYYSVTETDIDTGLMLGIGYTFANNITADLYYLTGGVDDADWDMNTVSLNIGYKFAF
ncbi:hypothetical protein VST7929_00751 [Vibrio stylophorae]|uniref:Outer membrane protein beta-barrel domain-containing protein n=1 Tax=Vibrio stylophorae TaxID=659351 RepID=A0ABM8ZRI3_9VIBR|nr:outer membrane beta-barrel protein [Vibrio stylophorae]CAH0532903.1 hypothetical protein VST7929_00751 [Vibrio stylophorae]